MRYREINWSDVTVGQEIHLDYHKPLGSGVSGKVRWIGPIAVGLVSGTAEVQRVIWRFEILKVCVEEYLDTDECLDYRPDNPDACSGPVDYRWTGGNSHWPRCEAHWDARMERRENSMEIYADSDVEPDWFDPTAIGERWDDDY